MSNCKLKLIEMRQETKAKRIFGLFKSKECVEWEPFDLHLSFKNISDHPFDEGNVRFSVFFRQSLKTWSK